MPHLRPRRRAATSATTTKDTPDIDIRETIAPNVTIWNTQVLANGAALMIISLAALAFIGIALNGLVLGIGIINPAWQTYKTLETNDSEDDSTDSDDGNEYVPSAVLRNNWCCYWIIAAVLYLFIQILSLPATFVSLPQPLIPTLLIPSLLYLTRNNASNSHRVYNDVARPILNAARNSVDGSIDAALYHVEYITSIALVQFYAAVHPYTASLQRAATAAMNTIEQGTKGDDARRVRRRRSGRARVTS